MFDRAQAQRKRIDAATTNERASSVRAALETKRYSHADIMDMYYQVVGTELNTYRQKQLALFEAESLPRDDVQNITSLTDGYIKMKRLQDDTPDEFNKLSDEELFAMTRNAYDALAPQHGFKQSSKEKKKK
jgi:hypothetical protein